MHLGVTYFLYRILSITFGTHHINVHISHLLPTKRRISRRKIEYHHKAIWESASVSATAPLLHGERLSRERQLAVEQAELRGGHLRLCVLAREAARDRRRGGFGALPRPSARHRLGGRLSRRPSGPIDEPHRARLRLLRTGLGDRHRLLGGGPIRGLSTSPLSRTLALYHRIPFFELKNMLMFSCLLFRLMQMAVLQTIMMMPTADRTPIITNTTELLGTGKCGSR